MKYNAARPLIPSPQPTGTPMAIVSSKPMIRTAIIKILSPPLTKKQLSCMVPSPDKPELTNDE
jgi:hypothetical protein